MNARLREASNQISSDATQARTGAWARPSRSLLLRLRPRRKKPNCPHQCKEQMRRHLSQRGSATLVPLTPMQSPRRAPKERMTPAEPYRTSSAMSGPFQCIASHTKNGVKLKNASLPVMRERSIGTARYDPKDRRDGNEPAVETLRSNRGQEDLTLETFPDGPLLAAWTYVVPGARASPFPGTYAIAPRPLRTLSSAPPWRMCPGYTPMSGYPVSQVVLSRA